MNYDLMFDTTNKPRLLLHSCCAPCSSYCLIYMRKWFDITCFFYNPNISDEGEYRKREEELVRLVNELNNDPICVADGELVTSKPDYPILPISVIRGDFEPGLFTDAVVAAGLEECPERGERCRMCFGMRLAKTYREALSGGFDFFSTTLTISPLKDAALINEIGEKIASSDKEESPVKWLQSDFKKKNGYKISIELSRRYDLYRQNFCGCDYSRR